MAQEEEEEINVESAPEETTLESETLKHTEQVVRSGKSSLESLVQAAAQKKKTTARSQKRKKARKATASAIRTESTVVKGIKQPLVGVHSGVVVKGESTGAVRSLVLPSVFRAPIRNDIVRMVHTDLSKNHRQAHGVSVRAGHKTSAESWGTGRAVARIPRVAGGGTSRSGQGAFGNMCRKGHMFSPLKTWRRWHRRVNVGLKRYALASAVAASGVPALVLARGHRVSHVPEIPLVVSSEVISGISKTKDAAALLKRIGAYADVERVKDSRKLRAGKGKMRNRRYSQRVGPLVVYANKGSVCRAFRNIPGVDLCCVTRLSLLKLAPGGHLGRFVVWTSDAFSQLNSVFSRGGFRLPRAKLSNANIMRVIKSDEVRKAVRPARRVPYRPRKKNPLVNFGAMLKLNPYAATARRQIILESRAAQQRHAEFAALKKAKKQLPTRSSLLAAKLAKAQKTAKAEATKAPKKKSPFYLLAHRKAARQLKHVNKKARTAFQGLLFS
jgi:large subunit ribosomal protein L4e